MADVRVDDDVAHAVDEVELPADRSRPDAGLVTSPASLAAETGSYTIRAINC
jgi:hypothetical protein